jgi:hypothetical protein
MMLRQLLRSGATPSLANPRGAAPKWTSTPGSHVRHGFGPPEYVDVWRNAPRRTPTPLCASSSPPTTPSRAPRTTRDWDRDDRDLLKLYGDVDAELSFYMQVREEATTPIFLSRNFFHRTAFELILWILRNRDIR